MLASYILQFIHISLEELDRKWVSNRNLRNDEASFISSSITSRIRASMVLGIWQESTVTTPWRRKHCQTVRFLIPRQICSLFTPAFCTSPHRVFWSVFIVSFVIVSCYNASLFWRRYLYNPTVVIIDRDYLNRNITFPPITLCLRNKLNETAMDEMLMWVIPILLHSL
jgi:Amiloride-sensitive sodium channel